MSDLDAVVAKLRPLLGSKGLLEGEDAEWRRGRGAHAGPRFAIRPASTEELSKALRICWEAGQPVVPQGGHTGLSDSTIAGPDDIALSLERMTEIEEIDELTGTVTVQCGSPLQAVQEAVEKKGYMLPLDLGARGSATIGGTISTNAGGNRVIRYGMMRDMVLGLEAVMADGTVVTSLNKMLKNNTGYDLKQLFIGTEGTLGVVTRAILRLRPLPRSQDTAFVSVESFEKLPPLLKHMQATLSGTLSAFEVMWTDFYALVTSPPALGRPPLPQGRPFYVLIETLGGNQEADSERFEAALGEALEFEMIDDAVIAKSESERQAMWAIRDDVGQVRQLRPVFIYDIGMPLDEMDGYTKELKSRLDSRWPGNRLMLFGHLGDGNLHVVLGVGDNKDETRVEVEDIVYGLLKGFKGSISAEHGIGLLKKPHFTISRSETEIELMRVLKRALDPKNILNPGKVVSI